ncbi:heme oxygenase-like protein [Hypomontagnella submonticulosa]|nr:heme oxygenase-like protein [Hypomontagnella submonticulosa]
MPSKTEDPVAGAAAPVVAPSDRSIGEAINISTRSLHTKLNKLIIGRLRLALPPQADDCSPYVHGMIHIASIYDAFESLWESLLYSDHMNATCVFAMPMARMRTILSGLHIDKLQRSTALKEDIRVMTRWPQAKVTEIIHDTTARVPVLEDFIAHIQRAVVAKPHVLVAYAWVLYMALFAGGRYIRGSFERIDPASGFWYATDAVQALSDDDDDDSDDSDDEQAHEADTESRHSMPGGFPTSQKISALTKALLADEASKASSKAPLGFFRFATPADGEDLKQEFKARVAAAALDSGEREDIVAEAQEIFTRMIAVVGAIDEALGTGDGGEDGAAAAAV